MGKPFSLEYLPMEVTLESLGEAKLPAFLGSTLRGVIGHTLHENREAYAYLYQKGVADKDKQDVVHPYMVLPPELGACDYAAGSYLKFQIILLGNAAQYAAPLVCAIEEIGNRGLGASRYPFRLVKITHSLDKRVIWQNGVLHVNAAKSAALPVFTLPAVRQLRFKILTPLRIRRKGEHLQRFDFPTLVRNIVKRIASIANCYGGTFDQQEADRILNLSSEISLAEESLEFMDLSRYSNRLEAKMDFGGMMGELLFTGDLAPFVPWFYAAEILHMGRNTTFGMGRVNVEFESDYQEFCQETVGKIVKDYQQNEKAIVGQLSFSATHGPTIGGFREDVWRSVFEQIIPKKFVIAQSVFIIDSEGRVSKEIDLAIFDESYTPYIFRYGRLKFIPIEAVAVVVECKSKSPNAKNLKDWVASVDALRTSPLSYARVAGRIAVGNEVSEVKPTQTRTRPIRILCCQANTKLTSGALFDIVLKAYSGKILMLIDGTKKNLQDWYLALNHADYQKGQEAFINMGKELQERKLCEYALDNGEESASLLSLNLQLNQLLMLINNPIPFPHYAYAKMFQQYKGEDE